MTHQSNLEHLLDYSFTQLGVVDKINQPVVLTETLANPNKSRALVNELMFECYQVPQLSIVNDSLAAYSFGQSKETLPDGLIIHSGHHSTSIIVVLDGKMQLEHTRRIPIGGNQHLEILQRSLNLKYPQFRQVLSSEACQFIQHKHTKCAIDY